MKIQYLHPYLVLITIPLILLGMILWKKSKFTNPWQAIIDQHLLNVMLPKKLSNDKSNIVMKLFLIFWTSIIIAMLGPAYQTKAELSYKVNQPTIIMVDLSQAMFEGQQKNLPIEQIKLSLNSWLKLSDLGPWALVLFTSEAYMASPLSDDGKTISALLPEIDQDLMPVDGYNIVSAFEEAQKIIKNAGFASGNILLFNHDKLDNNFEIAVKKYNKFFNKIAVVEFSSDLNKNFTKNKVFNIKFFNSDDLTTNDIPHFLTNHDTKFGIAHEKNYIYWHDFGRWFLIPAILCLLVLFSKGFSERL